MSIATDRRFHAPAWLASLALHGSVVTTALWVSQPVAPRGAGEASSREVGVVLRHAPVKPLEAPPEFAAEATEPAAPEEIVDAAPAGAAAASPFAELVERVVAEGAAPRRDAAQGGAGESTSGAGSGRALPIGQARVAFFGVEGVGSRFVYVLDRSVSMRGAPLAAAKRELVASLESLEDVHQFQVVFFNHRLSIPDLTGGQQRIAQGTEQNKRLAADWVAGVTPDGSTERHTALITALRMKPDVVFFLTDADGPMSYEELAEVARLNERIGATICTVEFGRGERRGGQNFLTVLAAQTGGQHAYRDTTRLGE